MENETIGHKLKILRKTRGLTQQQLADKLQVQRSTISNYEIGRRSPHLNELETIAKILGVNLEYFGVKENVLHDLVARAKLLFENENISPEEKAKVYKEIMKLYLEID